MFVQTMYWSDFILLYLSTVYEQEIERLKNENQQLVDANLIKTGETSILRADIQSLRTSFEKRETEANQELTALRKQIKQMESHHHKQVESSKTEMKFKVVWHMKLLLIL